MRGVINGQWLAVFFALVVLALGNESAFAACGAIPSSWPVLAGSRLKIGSTVKVNGLPVSNSDSSGIYGVNPTTGAVQNVSAAMPSLDPASFPGFSGGTSPSSPSSVAAGTYNTITVNNGAATPDTTFTGGTYYIGSLSVAANASVQLAPGDYFIRTLSIGDGATMTVSPAGPVRLYLNSNPAIGSNVVLNSGGSAANLQIYLYPGVSEFRPGSSTQFTGVVYAPGGSQKIRFGASSVITGALVTAGELELEDNIVLNYGAATQAQVATVSTCPGSGSLHHLEISSSTSGTGLTCSASTLTIKACTDSAVPCVSPYTGGVSGTLSSTGSGMTVNWDGTTGGATGSGFVIPAGGSVTKNLQVATAGTVTLGVATATPTPTNATTCSFGTNAPTNNNCVFTANTAGFIFSNSNTGNAYTIPSQVSGIATAANALYLRAVQASSTTPAVCTPAITSSTTAVNMGYACNNPTTCQAGNLATINATAIAPGGTSVNLAFDANGSAPITARYDDVGRITLRANATVTPVFAGATPVVLNGSSNAFVVAPHHFGISGITAGPIKAGNNFSAIVTAYNGLVTSTATKNFGLETTPESVTMSFAKCQPTGTGSVNGAFSASLPAFAGGTATAANFNWSEVGNGDLVATLASANYLGSGLTSLGNTGTGGTVCSTGAGNVGRFIPDHFDTTVVQTGTSPAIVPMTCPSGPPSLTCPSNASGATGVAYSGQPFTVQVTAKNLSGTTTSNYQNTFAKVVTLSAVASSGGAAISTTAPGGPLSASSIAVADFSNGVNTITLAKPVFTFAAIPTVPTDVYIRAIDTDLVSSLRVSSVEGGVKIVSGRVKFPNVYGSELIALPVAVAVQYYNGSSGYTWITSATDNATSFNSNLSTAGGNLVATTVKGLGSGLVVSSPGTLAVTAGVRTLILSSQGVSGSADLSLNVPSYLPSVSGRATFGIYKSPLIYRRENY